MTKLQMPKYIEEQRLICVHQRYEMCMVQHNSFVTAKWEYFYKQRRPDSKLKNNIMLHITRVYTVCYGKKELKVQKYNILEKFT